MGSLLILFDLLMLAETDNRFGDMRRQRIRARAIFLVDCVLQVQVIRDAHDGREVAREGRFVLVDGEGAGHDTEQ